MYATFPLRLKIGQPVMTGSAQGITLTTRYTTKWNMKKAGLLMAFVLVAGLLAVSCAEKGNDRLAGNWQKQKGSGTITFSK